MLQKKAKISLVVINFNGRRLLDNYFSSLLKQSLIPDEISLVDNASTDDSVTYVQKKYPKVIIIKNNLNEGTAGGSNRGFEKASGDLIIFQSNDISLDKNCIKYLVGAIKKDNKIGIVTSVLLRQSDYLKNNKKIIDNAGGIMDKYGFGMQKYPFKSFDKIPESREVFFAYGGSFIIRRDIFKKAGGFDSRFFTLNDDIDLSWRVRLTGYKIIYDKRSVVYHIGSATLGTKYGRYYKRYLSQRNNVRTVLKNYYLRDFITHLPIYFFILFAENIYYLYRLRFDYIVATFFAITWNLVYLPETLYMRFNIKRIVSYRKMSKLFYPSSLKIRYFNQFKKAI